jgi:hypothetical protein
MQLRGKPFLGTPGDVRMSQLIKDRRTDQNNVEYTCVETPSRLCYTFLPLLAGPMRHGDTVRADYGYVGNLSVISAIIQL